MVGCWADMSSRREYSDAEKAEYYRQKYLALQKGTPARSKAKKKYKSARGARFGSTTRRVVKDAETSDMIAAGAEALGAAGGLAVGGPPGAILGGILGRGAHGMFKALTGFGDYQLKDCTLCKGGMSPPQIINTMNNGGFIIRHREYLGDISATTAFTLQQYPINPGQAKTFPWLSQVAPSFEEYRFRGLVFEFKSLSSDAVLSSATSSALGSVILSTQYDALDDPFINKTEMENYIYASSGKPSVDILHPIECKKSQTVGQGQLFVRPGSVPAGGDIRLYDMGTFNLATIGMQAASGVAGELWATYEVELYKSKFSSGDLQNNAVGLHLIAYGVDSHAPFAGLASISTDASYPLYASPITFAVGGSNGTVTLTYPTLVQDMEYLVLISLYGNSALTINTVTETRGTNVSHISMFGNNNIASNYSLLSSSSSTQFLFFTWVKVPANTLAVNAGHSLQIQMNTGVTTQTDVIVIGWNPTVYNWSGY